MPDVLFETARLQVRQLRHADVDAMLAVYGDQEVVRWVGDGKPLDRALCTKWIDITLGNYVTWGYGMYALCLRKTQAIIGFAGLVHPGGQPEVEVKYALQHCSWGLGFATEAVRGLIAYGAEHLGLSTLIASTAPENEASQRVLLKVGMRCSQLQDNGDDTFTQWFAWCPGGGPHHGR